jgi:hypothetical protein
MLDTIFKTIFDISIKVIHSEDIIEKTIMYNSFHKDKLRRIILYI